MSFFERLSIEGKKQRCKQSGICKIETHMWIVWFLGIAIPLQLKLVFWLTGEWWIGFRSDTKGYQDLHTSKYGGLDVRETRSHRVHTTLKMLNMIYTGVTHVFEDCEDVTHLQTPKQSKFGPVDLPTFIIQQNDR